MNDQDLQHLDLLSLFHYILGGLSALFDPQNSPSLPNTPPPLAEG